MGTDAVIITYGGLLVQLFGFTHNLQKKDDIRLQTIMHRLSGAYSLHFPSQRFDILQNENVDFIQTQNIVI